MSAEVLCVAKAYALKNPNGKLEQENTARVNGLPPLTLFAGAYDACCSAFGQ